MAEAFSKDKWSFSFSDQRNPWRSNANDPPAGCIFAILVSIYSFAFAASTLLLRESQIIRTTAVRILHAVGTLPCVAFFSMILSFRPDPSSERILPTVMPSGPVGNRAHANFAKTAADTLNGQGLRRNELGLTAGRETGLKKNV
jgi:hypothetical protein